MRASELIQSVGKLPYGARQRAAALEGRRLSGSALLDELARGTSYERTLGLTVAQAAGEISHVIRLLRDPDPSVQARALATVAGGVAVSDDDLRILYDDAPAVLRTKLLRVIRKTGRWRALLIALRNHRPPTYVTSRSS